MKKIILLLFPLLLFIGSCSSPQVDVSLANIEEEMTEHPDSALAHLQALPVDLLVDKSQRAYYALLYSQALDKNYIDITNDSIIGIAVEYYEKHPSEVERLFRAYYYKARVLENGGNLLVAMDILTQAELLVDLIDDNMAKGLLYARMGKLYRDTYDYEKSIAAYNQALKYYETGNCISHTYYTRLNIGEVLTYTQQYEDALEYILPCKEWSAYNNQSEYLKCIILLSSIYEYTNDVEALDDVLNNSLLDYKGNIYTLLSNAYLAAIKGNRKQVEEDMLMAWSCAETPNDTANLIYYEYRINKHLGNYQSALSHKEHLFQMQDSIVREQLQQPLITVQRDFYREQTFNQELRLQNQDQQLAIMYIVIIAIILGILVLYLWMRNRMMQKEAEITRYSSYALSLEQVVSRKEADKDEMAMHIRTLFTKQFELLDELTQILHQTNSLHEKEAIYKKVKENIEQMSNSSKHMKLLEATINKYRNNVIEIARRELPNLSEKDIQLLCYFYIGVSTQSICTYTGMSAGYIYTRKSRIMKQMKELPDTIHTILLDNLPKYKNVG